MNFIPLFAGWDESGENHSNHAFFNQNSVTDFELGFVGAPDDGAACRFLHYSIVTQSLEQLPPFPSKTTAT